MVSKSVLQAKNLVAFWYFSTPADTVALHGEGMGHSTATFTLN